MIEDRQFYTTEELLAKKSGVFCCDVESYENYFLVAFRCYDTGKFVYFESINGEPFPTDWLAWMLDNFTLVGFNFKRYDLPMIGMCIAGYGCSDLKQATRELIEYEQRPSEIEKRYGFNTPDCNNVDLIEVAPLSGSLKLYAGRLHCHHLQDLPYDPNITLSSEQIAVTRSYCFNDLDNTALLLKELEPHLALRASLSVEFKKDLRSLSDAQLAQEIINTEITRITGKRPKRPGFEQLVGTSFNYIPPSYIQFQTQQLQDMLGDIVAASIVIGSSGHVICPQAIEGRQIKIADRSYTIGMGGLHSREKYQALTTGKYRILDRDVTGYYPNLILKNNFAPPHLGVAFIEALQSIVDKRYKAKRSGDKTTADGLKIASNGTFGKTSDPFSTIYSPPMMVQTTLTGQLSLLMAIEWLTLAGFSVVSANTDGIVTLVKPDDYQVYCDIFGQWEQITNLETEETEYKALYSRDVNNYIAIKMDGKHKAKGIYSEVGSALNSPLSKNPTFSIVNDAVIAHLTKNVPIAHTIETCQDVTRFVCLRAVKGGAAKDGRYLGKIVRWYYATAARGTINYCTSGNKVPLSDNGKPLMVLPSKIPDDVDRSRYIDMAENVLADLGTVIRKNSQLSFLGLDGKI